MAEVRATRLWLRRAVFVVLYLAIVLMMLLPIIDYTPWVVRLGGQEILALDVSSGLITDLLLALTCAWVVRRPDFVPVWVVALLFLGTDLLFYRPPGLWAALVVIGTEVLRARAPGLRSQNFIAEWLTVTAVIIGLTLAYRLALLITFVPRDPLPLVLMQMSLTLIVYPLVAFASHLLFGVRRVAPGEVDELGHRL